MSVGAGTSSLGFPVSRKRGEDAGGWGSRNGCSVSRCFLKCSSRMKNRNRSTLLGCWPRWGGAGAGSCPGKWAWPGSRVTSAGTGEQAAPGPEPVLQCQRGRCGTSAAGPRAGVGADCLLSVPRSFLCPSRGVREMGWWGGGAPGEGPSWSQQKQQVPGPWQGATAVQGVQELIQSTEVLGSS